MSNVLPFRRRGAARCEHCGEPVAGPTCVDPVCMSRRLFERANARTVDDVIGWMEREFARREGHDPRDAA